MNNLKILSVRLISTIGVFSCSSKGHNGSDGMNGTDGINGTDGTNGTNGTNGIVPTAFIDISGSDASCSSKQISITVTNNDSAMIACIAAQYSTDNSNFSNTTTATVDPNGGQTTVTLNPTCSGNPGTSVIEDIICWNENGMNRIVGECTCTP